MDGRLALSRRRQNGRVADQTLPLTERLLSRLPGPRAAWVLAWAAIPVAAGLSFDEGDLHVAPRLSSTSRVDESGITSALRTL